MANQNILVMEIVRFDANIFVQVIILASGVQMPDGSKSETVYKVVCFLLTCSPI